MVKTQHDKDDQLGVFTIGLSFCNLLSSSCDRKCNENWIHQVKNTKISIFVSRISTSRYHDISYHYIIFIIYVYKSRFPIISKYSKYIFVGIETKLTLSEYN